MEKGSSAQAPNALAQAERDAYTSTLRQAQGTATNSLAKERLHKPFPSATPSTKASTSAATAPPPSPASPNAQFTIKKVLFDLSGFETPKPNSESRKLNNSGFVKNCEGSTYLLPSTPIRTEKIAKTPK